MRVLLLGACGFIGRHLLERLIEETTYSITAFDLADGAALEPLMKSDRLVFHRGDIFKEDEWLEDAVAKCDVVLPFAGIAKPSYYLSHPLWTFELDFEQNLKVVRMAARHGVRVIFPSTSEVYGLSTDNLLLEDESPLIVGPISKMRWIYSCGKQMMDRIITAYGQEKGLRYTIFRPFNWIGPGLDSWQDAAERKARSITQMAYDALHRGEITLVGGGEQRRSFTWVGDGIDALLKILENPEGRADGQIFNVGNPDNNWSIREFAEALLRTMRSMPRFAGRLDNVQLKTVAAEEYYSNGYDDMKNRVPSIRKINSLLGWKPKVDLDEALRRTLNAMLPD